tara:strand:+ start:6574 stop:7053 length:480 start_codon:yes stop_codon:yes gene_type:complete
MITAIAAISSNGVIGNGGDLIWKISEDLKRFKDITSNNFVLMGRKTYESIGKPLPNRVNIIMTRDRGFRAQGCFVVHSVREAIDLYHDTEDKDLFIIGGGEIYELLMPFTDRLLLTEINKNCDGDTYFPKYPSEEWEWIKQEYRTNYEINYSFTEYRRH